jgi:CDP-diacylglycerol---serine O-phosphatidyltransferase
MKITRAVVPSLFTVLNMFSGFMSVIHASRGEMIPASWFIVLAAGFDALDGVMARITKSSSQFGVEIDSLSDVVSFGVAPAFLVYKFTLYQLDGAGVFISSLLMIFAGLRLARFNVQLVGFNKDHFVGLPVPASAITVASFVLNAQNNPFGFEQRYLEALPYLVVVLSLLMVSKVRYDTLPSISKKALKKDPWKFVFMGIAVVIVFVSSGSAIFVLFVAFILMGMVRYVIDFGRRLGRQQAALEEEESVPHSSVDS